MEGLIPLVYRAIKRSNTRRRYRSLSEPEGWAPERFPIMQETEMNGHHYVSKTPDMAMAGCNVVNDGSGGFGYRRNNSVPDFPLVSFFSPQPEGRRLAGVGTPHLSREAMGFKSHGRMLSCITGA